MTSRGQRESQRDGEDVRTRVVLLPLSGGDVMVYVLFWQNIFSRLYFCIPGSNIRGKINLMLKFSKYKEILHVFCFNFCQNSKFCCKTLRNRSFSKMSLSLPKLSNIRREYTKYSNTTYCVMRRVRRCAGEKNTRTDASDVGNKRHKICKSLMNICRSRCIFAE